MSRGIGYWDAFYAGQRDAPETSNPFTKAKSPIAFGIWLEGWADGKTLKRALPPPKSKEKS